VRAPLLGCIADDFTGGTDLAGILVKAGMRTLQTVGVPSGSIDAEVDAVVVALKSRTTPAAEAIAESIAALRWLRAAGCRQFYFKYCSTFDSTAEGNIGPVAAALLDELGERFTIACPAFPANRRSVYQGHLFVGESLLNESGMQNHPLTPMRDANLVRVLQAQVPASDRVGLVPRAVVAQGPAAIARRFAELRDGGTRFAIADAIAEDDLLALGRACDGLALVTGGSGMAMGLPANFRAAGLLEDVSADARLAAPPGLRAVLSGSCSATTLRQVAAMSAVHPSFGIDPAALARGEDVVSRALAFAAEHVGREPVMIHAGAAPESVQATQRELGVQRAGALIEDALATIARGLLALGVRRLIVAGGETSGAVVKSLGVSGLHIGPEIDPGVPWTVTTGNEPVALALKSGNFGSDDFFLKAWKVLA